MPPRISAPPTIRSSVLMLSRRCSSRPRRRRATAARSRASIQSASRACTVPSMRCRDGAERLEDRAVQDVRADGDLRVEAEEQDQDRRHQRAAAHPGHADEHADEQARERELPGHVEPLARAGIGQETNGRPVSRQPSLYASQPVQKPVTAASSASAATSSAEHGAGGAPPTRVGDRAAARKAKPIMFATRGGRESSSGPSPKRGWTSSK